MEKDRTNPNTSNVVTDGIAEEKILERLPVKSLLRFKSVSKQWKSMIESSYLAKKRLARYQNPKLLVLQSETSRDESSRTIFLETILKDHYEDNKIFICSYKFPDPHSEFYYDHAGRIMGYGNGLVCIYHFGYIYLINPTTRKLRILSPDFLRDCTDQPSCPGQLPISVGFGRDIVTGIYKVIMYNFQRYAGNTLVKTEVFNLTNGERQCICCPIRYDQLSNAMDLHTEKFHYVLLPSWYTNISESVNLWSLKDRLCLSDVLQYPSVDVWSLQQEDPSVKWEKILSVNILSIDSLDANFWKLGLAACSVRPVGEKPSKSPLEDVPDDHYKTLLFTENLVASV